MWLVARHRILPGPEALARYRSPQRLLLTLNRLDIDGQSQVNVPPDVVSRALANPKFRRDSLINIVTNGFRVPYWQEPVDTMRVVSA